MTSKTYQCIVDSPSKTYQCIVDSDPLKC